MLAATKVSTVEGSVRRANADDATALNQLLHGDVRIPPSSGNHVLVLDIAGRVVAALHVACDGRRAHVQFLVVDPAFAAVERAVEERMIGVATALCEAYGCCSMDICAIPQNDVAAARQVRALRGRS